MICALHRRVYLRTRPLACFLWLGFAFTGQMFAGEGNRADEPIAKQYSTEAGIQFVQRASQNWSQQRKCVACHTNGLGLAALSVVAPESEEFKDLKMFAGAYLRDYVDGNKQPRKQYGSVEGIVATTAFVALADARTGKGIQPVTRGGLDHAWRVLDKDGAWNDWLQCNWPPFESDVNFGPALMLVALGELSQHGEKSGLNKSDFLAAERMTAGLRERPPAGLHDKAMRLWADRYWPELVADDEAQAWVAEILRCQSDDGGWSMAAIATKSWRRDGGEPQEKISSAYPTAFLTYVLLQTQVDTQQAVIDRGSAWLRTHQRESGRWFTRSPRRDTRHYISHAATAYAVLCLGESR